MTRAGTVSSIDHRVGGTIPVFHHGSSLPTGDHITSESQQLRAKNLRSSTALARTCFRYFSSLPLGSHAYDAFPFSHGAAQKRVWAAR